jgi:hypothetical protein
VGGDTSRAEPCAAREPGGARQRGRPVSSALPELLKGGMTRGIQGSAADRPQFAGRKGVRHRLNGLPGDDDPPEVCGVAGRTPGLMASNAAGSASRLVTL